MSAEGLVLVQEAAEVQAGSERVMTEQESRRAEHEVQGLVQEAQEVPDHPNPLPPDQAALAHPGHRRGRRQHPPEDRECALRRAAGQRR